MANELMTWETMLSHGQFDEYSDQYGPHTQAVVNCFEWLDTISWFAIVGAESPGMDVEGVNTWNDALTPIMEKKSKKYAENGHLRGPSATVEKGLTDKKYKKHLDKAFKEIPNYADYDRYIPGYFDKFQRTFLNRHIEDWIRFMLVEIIASDKVETDYFRGLLPWYEAGHFPCGWDGEWPEGRLRIF